MDAREKPVRAARGGKKTARTAYVCSDCGDSFAQWFGRCPSCEAWGTVREFHPPADDRSDPRAARSWTGEAGERGALRLATIPVAEAPRLQTGVQEFDRILGGGLVPGSVVLVGGDPGIGKSTLLLQVAASLVARECSVLYASGEESASQIRLRAERLGSGSGAGGGASAASGGGSRSGSMAAGAAALGEILFLAESDVEAVARAVERHAPQVLVVDSIQTAYLSDLPAAPGSVAQVRESALALLRLAKDRGLAVVLVGHVTKEGAIAGPKTLEHMVDAVLYMEGERYQHYRILRGAKNRFGSVDEIGVFEMADDGLREVANPSQVFLSERTAGAVGSVVVSSLEGTRALLMEVQALVHDSRYGMPQRVATGYDGRRLELLLAVLAKRGGLDTSKHDVFVNVAGGLKIVEPASDLGVLLAVASARRDAPPHPDLVVIGEVGLAGEVRRVSHPERRIMEAARLGYERLLLPEANARELGATRDGVRLLGVSTVAEALYEGLQRKAVDHDR